MMSKSPSLLNSAALLRESQVLVLVQISRSTLGRWVSQGLFPQPVQLPMRMKAWRVEEVREWIDQRARSGERDAP